MKLKTLKSHKKRIAVLLGAFFLLLAGVVMSPQDNDTFFERTGQHKIDFSDLSGEYDSDSLTAVFEGKSIALAAAPEPDQPPIGVLGESTGLDKRIEVDLTNQKLYAFEGDKKVYEFVVSTGRTVTPTPTGEFRPWIKLRSTKMEGGTGSGYYYLPNVTYVMYFQNDEIPGWQGYGLHGTYWHDNFGTPMSHGCVNMKTEDAEKIFNWIEPDLEGHRNVKVTSHNPGTRITIYGETPTS